ncbi:MAG: hypothetical protein QM770_18445 [Tepidisphaeraceae bacterium]
MKKIVSFMSLVLATSSVALGHGVQTQLTYNAATQKLETRRIMTGSADVVPFGYSRETYVSAVTRAYVAPLAHLTQFPISAAPGYGTLAGNEGWYANFVPLLKTGTPVLKYPSGLGVSWQYDTNATVPGTFVGTPAPVVGTGWALSGSTGSPALVNLAGRTFGIRFSAGLQVWDGSSSSFIDPGIEQLQAFAGDATSVITPATPKATTLDGTIDNGTGPAFVNSPNGTTWSNAPHFSWSFRILGNGIDDTVTPDDGVYLAQYRIFTDAITPGGATVADSDVVSLLLYKNATLAEREAAVAALGFSSAEVQYAPEPATLMLLCASSAIALRRRNP